MSHHLNKISILGVREGKHFQEGVKNSVKCCWQWETAKCWLKCGCESSLWTSCRTGSEWAQKRRAAQEGARGEGAGKWRETLCAIGRVVRSLRGRLKKAGKHLLKPWEAEAGDKENPISVIEAAGRSKQPSEEMAVGTLSSGVTCSAHVVFCLLLSPKELDTHLHHILSEEHTCILMSSVSTQGGIFSPKRWIKIWTLVGAVQLTSGK